MEEDNYDIMFKAVLVGDSFVGKTNILSKYLKNEFQEDSKATVGVEFGSKQFNIEGHLIRVQIWDTAGQERYKSIASSYYKGSKGAFIVYDITNRDSFESVDKWASKNITMLLIGNKCDLEDKRKVAKEEGQEKANNLQLGFLEAPAFSGENLEKAFETMINEVYKKCHEEMLADEDLDIIQGEEINLDKKKDNNEKKQCCA